MQEYASITFSLYLNKERGTNIKLDLMISILFIIQKHTFSKTHFSVSRNQ